MKTQLQQIDEILALRDKLLNELGEMEKATGEHKAWLEGRKEGFRYAMHGLCHENSETVEVGDEDQYSTACVDCLKLDLY